MITVKYDPRELFSPIRVLLLDAKWEGKRVTVRLTEGLNTIEDSIWSSIADRPDVQEMIGAGVLVVASPPTDPLADSPIESTIERETAPFPTQAPPVTREQRLAELQTLNGSKLYVVAKRHDIKKPESGNWSEAIDAILDAEFGVGS